MYFIGIDLGTNGIKAGIVDEQGEVISSSYLETSLISSAPGRMEQDPQDFYSGTLKIIKDILQKSKISPKEVTAIGLDGQMGGVIGIDRNFDSITGLDMGMDIRSEKYNDYIHKKYKNKLRKITCGSPRNTPKIMWWKREYPEVYNKIIKFITLTGYVGGKLAGLKSYQAYIDYTMLSFFGMEDILKLDWSDELCQLYDLEIEKLPTVVPPWKVVGRLNKAASKTCGLMQGTPIVAGAGDQPAGLLGAGLLEPGVMLDVSGSSVLLFLVVDRFVPDIENGAVMYIPSIIKGIYYAFIYINGGGICLRWFRDQFLPDEKTAKRSKQKSKYDLIEEKAKLIYPGSKGLMFIPYFGGRQCPYNRSLKGAWIGLSWGHKREHMYRAILESIAYEYCIGLSHLKRLFPDYETDKIFVTGGGSSSRLWNQIKADVLGKSYLKIESFQFALRGSGLLAGYGVGAVKDLKKAALKVDIGKNVKEFEPAKANKKLYESYSNIYKDIFTNTLEKTYNQLVDLMD